MRSLGARGRRRVRRRARATGWRPGNAVPRGGFAVSAVVRLSFARRQRSRRTWQGRRGRAPPCGRLESRLLSKIRQETLSHADAPIIDGRSLIMEDMHREALERIR